ncbi:hypothetical protein LZK75_24230 [Rhizobium leguminosarum]|nr:hypothetical protein LZK75_24230 [Rhizobium leguminosarum]
MRYVSEVILAESVSWYPFSKNTTDSLRVGRRIDFLFAEPVERFAEFIGQPDPHHNLYSTSDPEIGCGVEIIGCFPATTPPKTRRISDPEAGEFRDSEVGFFFVATLTRLSTAIGPQHPTEKTESVGGSSIKAPSTSTPA